MFVLRDDASRGTIIRAAHCAHRVPVCSTVTVLLCGGNDCRCRRKALVGMTGCKMQINKQTFFFFFITLDDKSVVPLTFDSSQPTCTDLCLGATLFFFSDIFQTLLSRQVFEKLYFGSVCTL